MSDRELSGEEFLEISRQLEQHHSVFYMLWEMGKPIFDDTLDTAAVSFDDAGDLVAFQFNPDFWDSLTPYERLFVIAHECLHVILLHGIRTCNTTRANQEATNAVLDIVVNHLLIRKFGFSRTQLSMDDKLCWVDTVFPDKDFPDNQSFEFYFNRLPKITFDTLGTQIPAGVGPLDNHEGLNGATGGENLTGDFDSVIDELNEKMTDQEKEGIRDIIDQHCAAGAGGEGEGPGAGRGNQAGGRWTFAKVGVIKRKKKWETVIKKWSKKYDRPEFRDIEQWARLNRRYSSFDTSMLLPSDMEVEYEMEGKITVWFFQDTSGSCAGFRDRFFKAALSLAPDRFDVRMHCFDTQVYETTLESKKLYGFGGTAFDPLERYVQQTIKKENIEYPKAVFVVTDGLGTRIKPQIPQNWYWFLSRNYTSCIPKECNIFLLKDYE